MSNVYWINDPTVLYKNEKYMDCIPNKQMTKAEMYNSITRLILIVLFGSIILGFGTTIRIYIFILLAFIYLFGFHLSSKEYLTISEEKPKKKVTFNLGSAQKLKQYQKTKCRKPTPDNPFMNPTLSDYELADQPVACNADDEDIKDKINDCFKDNLFMNAQDLFERENSQRQFFTLPTMNPDDQTKLGKWLYDSNNICKNNPEKCLKYEDLRMKRSLDFD